MEWSRFLPRNRPKQLHIPSFLVLVHGYRINIPHKFRFIDILHDILLDESDSLKLKNYWEVCKRCYRSINLTHFHCYSSKTRIIYCTCHKTISVPKNTINIDIWIFDNFFPNVFQHDRGAGSLENDLVISFYLVCSCSISGYQQLNYHKKKHADYKGKTDRIKLLSNLVWCERPCNKWLLWFLEYEIRLKWCAFILIVSFVLSEKRFF